MGRGGFLWLIGLAWFIQGAIYHDKMWVALGALAAIASFVIAALSERR